MIRGRFTKARWVVAVVALMAAPLALAQSRSTGSGRSDGAPASATARASNAAAADASQATGPTVAAVPANVCVPPDRAQAILACPSGSMRFGNRSSTAPPAAARATLDSRNKAKNAKKAGPSIALDESTARRRAGLQRRSRDLLIREVQLTATLARQTPVSDSHRPDVLMRLAENLQELSSAENSLGREMDEAIFQARRANNRGRVAELQRAQQQRFNDARSYRQQLIRTFERLVTDHPRYTRMDEVLFYLAFAYQDSNDMQNARRVYLTLIQRYPQSRFIPNAYLSFAEFFFEQGAMDEARQFYDRVISINTAENQVLGYAMYKQAWVLYNLQRFEDCLQMFFRVIDYGRQHTDNPSVVPLMRAARNELVSAYGAVYGVTRPLRTTEALNTFRRYAADDDNAYEMLEHLGELYQDNGQWPNSVAVYHELMAQKPNSDRFCYWQGQVAKAIVASRPREDQMREVTRLLDVYDQFRAPTSTRSVEAKHLCRDRAAQVVFDVASHWHLEAIGRSAEGQQQTRGTRDQATMARAAALYGELINRFPDLDQVQFPDYDRRDWPSRYRIAYYMADILRDQGNFAECGSAYDRVVEMNPGGEFTEDAAYKAVLCYNDLFSAQLANQSRQRPTRTVNQGSQAAGNNARARNTAADEAQRLAPRDLNAQESGMARAFTRYICYVGNNVPAAGAQPAARGAQPATAPPPPNVGQGSDDPRTVLLTIKYRRAYLYYAANKFEEAATLFQDVSLSDPNAPDPENLREIAADLFLDCLNVMGTRWNPTRPACFTTMVHDVPRLQSRFCTGEARSAHAEFCTRMEGLGCQILRKHAESLHGARRYAEAAHQYIVIARDHAECRNNPDARIDEVLYNAALEYDAANLLGRAMRVRDRLVDLFLRPHNNQPARGSQWAQRALYRLAGNYQAIQVFSRASDLYEEYAEFVHEHAAEATHADPEAVNQAAEGLRQATLFRIGLGEEDKALDNAAKFARYFGADANRRRQAAGVIFSIGQVYQDRAARLASQSGGSPEERGRRAYQIRQAWQDVVRHYTNFINRYARNGTLDQQIQGNVALARGYWNLDDQTNAQRYFNAAVRGWGAPPTGAAGAAASGPAPGEQTIRQQLGADADEAVEKSKDAVAEAKFYLAESVYRRFTQRRLPVYHGSANRRAYDAWAQHTLQPFIVEQRRYLEQQATPQYTAVIALHVPNWEIAAAARLADMFYQFAQYIRTAEVPPDVRRNPDLLDAYNVMRDEFTQQFVNLAKTGFEGCISRSTQVHWFNEWSQLCERSLNQIDRRQYPLADEVRVEPTLVFSRPTNSRPVYQLVTGTEGEDEGSASGGSQGLNGTADTSDSPASRPAATGTNRR